MAKTKSSSYDFFKMVWDYGWTTEEELRMFVGYDITKEEFEEITGIKY